MNKESTNDMGPEAEMKVETETESQISKYYLRNHEDVKKLRRLNDYVMLAESNMNAIKEFIYS